MIKPVLADGISLTDYSVNATGIAEIHQFLAENHKMGGDHFTPDMLRAWAADAEFQLAEGNPASIEIRAFDAIIGHTETFDISDAGIDWVEYKDGEPQ